MASKEGAPRVLTPPVRGVESAPGSLRTVETHLTHSYQKLGIESRGQLASALLGAHARPARMPAGTGPMDAAAGGP